MATISVVKKHALPLARAKTLADGVAKDLHRKFDLQCSWDGDTCRFTRSGLDGTMKVERDRIAIDVRLGFLLSAVAPSIERAIHEQIDAVVAQGDAGSTPKAKLAPAAKKAGRAKK
jgi:putative polyhydroxyalkanoate system protein